MSCQVAAGGTSVTSGCGAKPARYRNFSSACSSATRPLGEPTLRGLLSADKNATMSVAARFSTRLSSVTAETYWSRFGEQGWYFAGDGARYDLDGAIWVLGRIDDVLNVSGHRLSTAEVESALVGHSGADSYCIGDSPDAR
jgi:acyl-coenzyme A synthetase/AMP-(fatty) acid ligase